jgi:hypothetical protein
MTADAKEAFALVTTFPDSQSKPVRLMSRSAARSDGQLSVV